ncbi:hypothetical protein WJX72_004341 [[Myrmecia] bisecta]|uniref:GAF domain-containing protein n=1 Tax=[Myrmecia] bisecta TaxID=41462 RepID=A0AAW1PAU7_9CHLO
MDELCARLSRCLVLGEVAAPDLAGIVARAFPGCQAISVALVGQEGDHLLLHPVLNDMGSVAVGQPVAATAKCLSGTAVWTAFETGQLQVLDSNTARAVHFRDWKMLWERQGVRSAVTAPLQAEEGRIGALTVGSSRPECVDQEQVKVAALLLGLCLVHAKCKHDLQVAVGLLQNFPQQPLSQPPSPERATSANSQHSLQATPVMRVEAHAPGSCEDPECGPRGGQAVPAQALPHGIAGQAFGSGSTSLAAQQASIPHEGRVFAFRCYACQAENAVHILPEDLGLTRMAGPSSEPGIDLPAPPFQVQEIGAGIQPHEQVSASLRHSPESVNHFRPGHARSEPASMRQSGALAAAAPGIPHQPTPIPARFAGLQTQGSPEREGAGEALEQHLFWQTFRDAVLERKYTIWHNARCSKRDLIFSIISFVGTCWICFIQPYQLAAHYPRTWPLMYMFMLVWLIRSFAPARYLRIREPLVAGLLAYNGMWLLHFFVLDNLLQTMAPEHWVDLLWMLRMSSAEALHLMPFGLQMRFKVFFPVQLLNVLVALAFLPRTCGLMYPAGAWPGCLGAFSALVVVLGLLVPATLVWYNELRARRAFLAIAHTA